MLLPLLPCPLSAARIAGLQATVLILLTLLIKARVQIKAASTLGWFLLSVQTLVFLAIMGALGMALVGGGATALWRQRTGAQPVAG